MLRLLKHLDQAVIEGRNEQEPFQERSEHDRSHDGHVDDLAFPSAPAADLICTFTTYVLHRPWLRY